MADEQEGSNTRLQPGKHYWRQGDSLYLVLQSCLPLYLRYVRNIGEQPVIREFHQMRSLLEGELYFERREGHPTRDAHVFVISLEKLNKKGTTLSNFLNDTDPDD
ncbi:hypothetical protein D3C85_1561160 [compost metagenome]